MRICWIKLNGWRGAFNERVEAIACGAEEVCVVRPRPKQPVKSISADNVRLVDLWPPRDPILKPRILIALYPIWIFQSVIILMYFHLFVRNYDIYHSLDFPFSALVLKIYSKFLPCPTVASVRGLHKFQPGNTTYRKIRYTVGTGILDKLSAYSLSHADYVIAKSQYQIDYINNTFGISVKSSSIPTGVDIDGLKTSNTPPEEIIEFIENSNNRDTIVLHLGRFNSNKGTDLMLELAGKSNLKKIKFVFVGEFLTESFKNKVLAIADEYELKDSLLLYEEFIPFEEVPQLIKKVDAVCLMSKPSTEGVPRVLQESVLLETSVIATDVPGVAEHFRGKEGCHIIDPNPKEFREAIERCGESQPNPNDFVTVFDLYANYDKYRRIYREIIESNESISN